MSATVSILGLGTMGGRVAARAAEQDQDVVGFDPDPAACKAPAAAGAHIAQTAEEAVAAASLILLSVPRPEHVLDLATTTLREASAETIVVDLSTIDPGTARAAATELANVRVTYIDAPVLGRPDNVGSWTLVAGGPTDAIATATPTLTQVAAAHVVRVGDTGSGSVVKLLNNLMFGAINAVTAEAIALCRDNDVDPAAFVETVAGSGAATVSNLFRDLAPRIIAGDDDPVFALDLLAKDNHLALNLATSSATPAPIAEIVDAINSEGLRRGYGNRDSAAVFHTYEPAQQHEPNS